ncbi:DUF1515 family protein [Bradyrhizobium diazoefficiens]|nr:DUF1515 family protein [Bradyrhizobium diazoefficiens]MBR0774545.1 DUF1515 family protein [Bradyrhizobium diazoefficiens]
MVSIQAALRDMAKLIGGLESSVTSLTIQWRQQDEKASLGRRDLHQKIDAALVELTAIDGRVTAAIADIAEMRPTVDAIRDARLQAAGAVKAGHRLGRGVYWLATALTLGVGWVMSHWLDV